MGLLPGRLVFLGVVVGENGIGKSTVVETIATAWHDALTGAQALRWSAGSADEDADLDMVRNWQAFLEAPERYR